MTTMREGMPDDTPDMFDLLTGELSEHMIDPYLRDLNREAHICEDMINEPGNTDVEVMRQEFTEYLNEKWRYFGAPIEVTGTAWVRRAYGELMEPEMWIGKRVISHGLTIIHDNVSDDSNEPLRVGHYVSLPREAELGENGGPAKTAVVLLNDILQLELPQASPEMREQRFAYYFPDDADWIDELAFTSPRTDQVLSSYREYFFDADLDNPEDVNHLHDATAFLLKRAEIERYANYRISLKGDVIVIGSNNEGKPANLAKPYTHAMKIVDMHMRPADVQVSAVAGKHRCSPFVEALSFEKDGRNRRLLIPCTSILDIYSLRHDSSK